MPLDAQSLCDELGISPRTLRNWVREGIVARPARRGPATVYDDGSVLRARAAVALRKRNVGLRRIRRELDRASADELRALAGEAPLELPASDPRVEPSTRSTPPPVEPEEVRVAPPDPEPAPLLESEVEEPLPGDGWRRIVLMEGLELHLAEHASPVARRVAADICAARWPAQNVTLSPVSPKRTEGPDG